MGHPAFFAKKTRLVTVVSDTSPISYLVLIGAEDVLSALYGQVIIPEAVHRELRHPQGPEAVREWISLSPPWLVVEETRPDVEDREHNGGLDNLDPGERAAILLAEQEETSLLLIDERTGRSAARTRGLEVTGTIGVLGVAVRKGHIGAAQVVQDLRATSFRASSDLYRWLLKQEQV